MRRTLFTVLALICFASVVQSQTVTVTKPGESPVVTSCPNGCDVAVKIPAPEPPPQTQCTFTVAPQGLAFEAAGGTLTITVTSNVDTCTWTSSTPPSWATVAATPSQVVVTASANTASTTRTGTITVAGVDVVLTQAAAQTQPPPTQNVLERLSCTTANYPNCGMSAVPENTFYRRQLLVGQGPNGTNAVEFILKPGTSGGQFYQGWTNGRSGSVSTPATRYLRTWVWMPGPTGQQRGYAATMWDSKFFIMSDGGDASSRLICLIRDNGQTNDTRGINCSRNIDTASPYIGFTLGQWHSVQVEVKSGSGQVKVWVDQHNYATPSAVSPATSFNVSNWQNVNMGFYSNITRGVTVETPIIRLGAFEFATTFDPTWGNR